MVDHHNSAGVLDVAKIQEPLFATHASGENVTYEWRVKQLQTLFRLLVENTEKIRDAICRDLGRDPTEAILVETKGMEGEIQYALKNLKDWMIPKAVPSPALLIPATSHVERRPLNAPGVLIIAPFNYPVLLSVRPLIGALAGGNPAVIKPSELCPTVSSLLQELFETYFDAGIVRVVQGGIPETTALLKKSWAKVMFTGSGRVGAIIAQACGKTLTPTVMELGGKCPVVVDESVPSQDIQNVADRIIWGKLLNSGQTCIAPDTLFVHEKHAKALCTAMVNSIEQQFGKDPKKGELARMVNSTAAARLVDWIKEVEGTPGTSVVYGGSSDCDVDSRYVCPTLVLNPAPTSKMLSGELFGPVLPLVTFSSRDEAIERVQNLGGGIPLHSYYFVTSDTIFKEYVKKCPSSGATRNDVMVQGLNVNLPLGGLGSSGYGRYFGKYTFDTFTHVFPVVYRPLGAIWDLNNIRCHPYAGWKGNLLENYLVHLPDIPVMFPAGVVPSLCTTFLTLGIVVGLANSRQAKNSLADLLELGITALRK